MKIQAQRHLGWGAGFRKGDLGELDSEVGVGSGGKYVGVNEGLVWGGA